jgi:hypothetical protein
MMVLEATLKADYSPGSNKSGDMACADWRFLLPQLRMGVVVSVGIPRPSSVRLLSQFAREIYVLSSKIERRQAKDLTRFGNVHTSIDQANELPADGIDLLLIEDLQEFERAGSPVPIDKLFESMTEAGAIYFDGRRAPLRAALSKPAAAGSHFAAGSGTSSFWLTKQFGEVRTAVPLGQRRISSFFFHTILHGKSLKKRLLSHLGRLASDMGFIEALIRERATVIVAGQGENLRDAPPRYLREVASRSGVDLSQFDFGFSARGLYDSNKVVFFLYEKAGREPQIVAKATRVASFNDRLEQEWSALQQVEKMNLAPAGTYPKPLFFGYHGGLAILGQAAMKGKPFRVATTTGADCPVVADAIDWITQLGVRSADTSHASSVNVSDALLRLFDTFVNIYDFPAEHTEYLRRQIVSVSESEQSFPVVFGHGDAGVWNVTVESDGRSQFLDWEAADPRGMPLWDLFYFVNSFSNWVSKKRTGSTDTIANFRSNLLQPGPLNDLLVSATHRYCESVGLHGSLVAPMFFTCWMHRALRQATWAEVLQEGHFVRLLRLCIEERRSPGLARLFGTR